MVTYITGPENDVHVACKCGFDAFAQRKFDVKNIENINDLIKFCNEIKNDQMA